VTAQGSANQWSTYAVTVTRERTSLLAGFGVLILTVLLVGTAVLADRNNAPQGEWLMVMKAEQAEFAEAPNGNYTLTLTDVDPVTLAFTDRPERRAQTWDTTVILDYWESEFDGDPPNAAVTADGVRIAVTLSDPRVGMSARSDGAVTPNAGAITFTAAPLPGQVPPTGTINQPTVFLDGAPTSVNSQVTD
jgi:hypothetical protein